MGNKPIIDFPQTLMQGGGPAAGATSLGGGDEGFDFVHYLNVLRRHKWGILGIALLATVYGVFKAMQETPLYRASLTMLIEPHQPKIVNIQQLYLPINSYLFYETQTQIIKSRAVAERVVDKLRLDERADYETVHRPVAKGLVERLKTILGLQAESSDTEVGLKKRVPLTPDDRARRRAALVARIQSGLGVWSSQKSQIFTITYVSPDPQFAADVANAVAEAYVDFSLESKLTEAKHASNWLTERLEELRKKVIESEAELHAFQSKEGMIDTKSIKQLESGRLTTFNAELIEAQTRYAELAKRYGPKHPKMINAQAELEEARRRLEVEEEKILEAKRKANVLEKLERNVATNRQLYDLFMTRFKETDITTDEKATNARILDRAQVPARPFKPNKMQIVSTYFGVGLLLGVMLAFLREYLDNTYKTPADVEERLKMPVLGIVPLLTVEVSKKNTDQKSPPERFYIIEPRSSFAESVNHIRTGILFAQVDNPPKTLMVTSSVQGEGKTTLSSNLALAFSQLGRTLLLDADLRKPRVAQISGLDKQSGLVDLVAGQKTMRECIVRDRQAENLYILRTGTMPPNPLELLSSDKFAKVLKELKESFSHIVIDTAPILPVSDAIVLGHVVDALVMVIQADRTSRALTQDAVKRLKNAKVMPLGVVLTQVSQRKISQYYYDRYYYDSYYGSYHAYGEDPKKKKRA